MADNKDKKVLKSSIEREQNQTCLNSAEREKIKGSTNLNVPHLRFPEFSGEWESARLSSFTKKITKKNKGNVISNVLCNSANLGIIPQSEYFDRDIANTENTDTYYIIENGDFVYNPRKSVTAPYGPVNMYKGKNSGIISPLYLCFTVKDISKDFLLNWFKGNTWYRYVYSHGDTGVRYDRVSIKDDIFLNMPINIPVIGEQEKISKILNLLDERIATQNKIIEDLKLLKSAIIEEHYKKQKKQIVSVADLGQPFNVGNLSKEDLSETGHLCIIYGELFTTYGATINVVESHTHKFHGMTLSRKGDLLFPSSTTVDAVSLIAPSVINVDGVVLGGDMFGIHISSDFNPQYLSYFFNLIARNQLAKYAKGSTIIHLHYKEIEKAKLLLPSLEEQNRMATCMAAFDERITIEYTIQKSLMIQKQYLLRQMFI